MEWIKKVAPVAGYIIGLVLVAVGAVMTLQSGMKLAFAEPNTYYYNDSCDYDLKFNRSISVDGVDDIIEPTDEEREECLKDQEEREQKQFKNRNVQNLIDGISLVIVGGLFWGLFRERRK